MKIAMYSKISGGRGDGTDWPDPHVPWDVDDAEGAQLCGGGLAYKVADSGSPASDPDPDMADPTRGGVKPIVNSPKAMWVEHAVAQGADRAEAEAMKKTDLIARYGSAG